MAKKYPRVKIEGVRVAKIKNRYMFRNNKGADPNKFHYYLIYTDKYSGQNIAVQTTHLYQKDTNRFRALANGHGIKMQLPGFETPTMILKKFHTSNARGQAIDFAHRDVRVKSKVSRSKARRLYRYVASNI